MGLLLEVEGDLGSSLQCRSPGILGNREGLGVRLPIMLGVVAIVVLRSHHNLVGDQEGQVEPQTWPMRPLTHLTSR